MSKKSKATTAPSRFAQPYITTGANALQQAYDSNQGNVSNINNVLQSNIDNVADKTLDNDDLNKASQYNQSVLSGNYLNPSSNSALSNVINMTNQDVTNSVNGAIGTRGLTGGSAQTQLLAKTLGQTDSNLLYNNYNNERGYQQQAAENASNIAEAGNNGVNTLDNYLENTAALPQSSASSLASNMASLLGNYNTTTQNQGLGSMLASLAGAGLSGFASNGFKI
ncbi:hypothetical protein [Zymomonas mobilis]|uniref:Uncharacterized protein n=1 Tax=Zymomonas mobilis subsp. pomaceae (strain ATCC 29192 / DSM 22645 / JCM 10191 / CCUG 17912 / NBRC 13757 / NCIMB 11200 / NRRL B-4491 / Barker I) TaxID=579138 RepID=F8ESD8_ZYMMT|nr:hypothetical protein [Zymomonas mobilis]AEI37713.1 hypothetical protein Zymop_0812 [Zymomonas mobilis subsp. pomaceae ATCC 29192]MDX5949080.1 hypothetical protein [Zymomonas mobilis subsp. pomaceae]GEB88885.1 hypothetical protein ZMO02_05220 [Zymomonas mobilis subsp. pomaceae]